jgi:hypothetical protein
MKKLLVVAVLLFTPASLWASGICAGQMTFVPAQPTTNDSVELRVDGWCSTSCSPRVLSDRYENGTIRLESRTREGTGCLLAGMPYTLRYPMGKVPAGEWDVVLVHDDRIVTHSRLIVRDAVTSPFEVLPSFGRQGTEVFLRGVPGCPGTACESKGVRFNGVEAARVRKTADGLFATVPALTEGLIDVSVVSPDGSLLTADNAFRYTTRFDSAADYFRVLFPITFAGPGANGATWTSQNVVSNGGPVGIDTIPSIWLLPGIGTPVPSGIPPRSVAYLGVEDRDGGALMLIPRGLEQFVTLSSHIRDTSRSAENLGTEIPVVTENETASEVRITGIPADVRYRPRLRIYDIDGNSLPVTVRVVAANGATLVNATLEPRRSFVCVTTPCEDVAFVALDFNTALPSLPGAGPVEVVVTGEAGRRLWAFVTLTNNATNLVTTYSPH